MKKLTIAVAVVMIVAMAPAAFAEHCLRCKPNFQTRTVSCVPATGPFPGYEACVEISDSECDYLGSPQCVAHGSGLLPLETEFIVASVERLDDPATATSATLVAAAELPQSSTR